MKKREKHPSQDAHHIIDQYEPVRHLRPCTPFVQVPFAEQDPTNNMSPVDVFSMCVYTERESMYGCLYVCEECFVSRTDVSRQ